MDDVFYSAPRLRSRFHRPIFTVAVFSFQQGTHSINEAIEAFDVQVSLEYGVLDKTVELQLISQSGSAIGIYWINTFVMSGNVKCIQLSCSPSQRI